MSKSDTPRRRLRALVGLGASIAAFLGSLIVRAPTMLLVPSLIVVLAGVDILGAIAAKSWARTPGMWVFLAGSGVYILLFWIYAQTLRHGELTTVTVGWVAMITVGCMLLDHYRYGVHFPASKWVAAALVAVLLGYLLAGTGTGTGTGNSAAGDTVESACADRSWH